MTEKWELFKTSLLEVITEIIAEIAPVKVKRRFPMNVMKCKKNRINQSY